MEYAFQSMSGAHYAQWVIPVSFCIYYCLLLLFNISVKPLSSLSTKKRYILFYKCTYESLLLELQISLMALSWFGDILKTYQRIQILPFFPVKYSSFPVAGYLHATNKWFHFYLIRGGHSAHYGAHLLNN